MGKSLDSQPAAAAACSKRQAASCPRRALLLTKDGEEGQQGRGPLHCFERAGPPNGCDLLLCCWMRACLSAATGRSKDAPKFNDMHTV